MEIVFALVGMALFAAIFAAPGVVFLLVFERKEDEFPVAPLIM